MIVTNSQISDWDGIHETISLPNKTESNHVSTTNAYLSQHMVYIYGGAVIGSCFHNIYRLVLQYRIYLMVWSGVVMADSMCHHV